MWLNQVQTTDSFLDRFMKCDWVSESSEQLHLATSCAAWLRLWRRADIPEWRDDSNQPSPQCLNLQFKISHIWTRKRGELRILFQHYHFQCILFISLTNFHILTWKEKFESSLRKKNIYYVLCEIVLCHFEQFRIADCVRSHQHHVLVELVDESQKYVLIGSN